jgi:hypothetical protein
MTGHDRTSRVTGWRYRLGPDGDASMAKMSADSRDRYESNQIGIVVLGRIEETPTSRWRLPEKADWRAAAFQEDVRAFPALAVYGMLSHEGQESDSP